MQQVEELVDSEGALRSQEAALRSNEAALKAALATKLDEHQQLMDVIGELTRQKAELEGGGGLTTYQALPLAARSSPQRFIDVLRN